MQYPTTNSLADLINHLPPGMNGSAAQELRHAYAFAAEAHGDLRRMSGERYIDHDVAVARLLLDYEPDVPMLVAAILHDIIRPHTGVTLEDIQLEFGNEVAALISGLETIHGIELRHNAPEEEGKKRREIEFFRKSIISIIEGESRIILIRLADCLQDLRKAANLPGDIREQVANDALKLYAPLANRLGIWNMKWEIEDLAFRFLQPTQYREIASKLDERRTERARRIEVAAERLRDKVAEMGLKAEVTGRSKHIYSIYRKMKAKSLAFEEIYDIQALRVILETDEMASRDMTNRERESWEHTMCYQVMGAVHGLWQPIPREFDDYIAAPKANGYKSLHTAVMDPNTGEKLEVQIRTRGMHEEAEKGVAAHWAYKEGGMSFNNEYQRRIQSLRNFLTGLPESPEVEEAEAVSEELAADRFYVFTKDGDVVEVTSGCTPIDFAYQIHTSLGHACRGARVNGKMVGLDHKLKPGDQVEIIKAKRGGPSRDWMNASLGYTGSARTRSKVRQWFRKQERGKNIEQGREVVERELKRLSLNEEITIEDLAAALKYDQINEFLARVGFGDLTSNQLSGAITLTGHNKLKKKEEDEKKKERKKNELNSDEPEEDDALLPLLLPERAPKTSGMTVMGVGGLETRMAGCCNPIPPEKIRGYITRGHGITIHRDDCPQLAAIDEKERIIEVDWGLNAETYPIPVVVQAYRRPNLVDDLSAILRGQKLSAPKTKTISTTTMVTVYMVVEVTSLEQLNWLLKKFETVPNVFDVRRRRWS